MEQSVITIDSQAFRKLIEFVISQIKEKQAMEQDPWITSDEAMRILNITSRSTLQMLRDTGQITFSQPMHKVILYNRESILEYIQKHAKEKFA